MSMNSASPPLPLASVDEAASPHPASSSPSFCYGHDSLERRSSKSRLSKQNEVEVTEDVAPCDTSGDAVTDAGSNDVTGDSKTNGDTSCCLATMTDRTGGDATASGEAASDGGASGSEVVIRLEAQGSVDSDSGCSVQALNPKVKLVRCQAVCDDASPPPEVHARSPVVVMEIADTESSSVGSIPPSANQSSLMVSPTGQTRPPDRLRLGQGSSQGSTVSDGGPSPAMSRASSIDTAYTDSTGTNLEEFIVKTLNKNRNDRSMLIRLEAEMTAFITDSSKEKWKFPQMSSYHRMLVHRVAAFFGLDHNIDDSGKCVVISRQQSTRLPDFKFRDHIHDDLSSNSNDDQPKKSILKRHRDCTSLEENLGVDRISLDDRKSKSFEERTEEYMEARSRIFKEDSVAGECKVDQSSYGGGEGDCGSKDEMQWRSDERQWRSTDSSGYNTDESSRLLVRITKASSFHGVTVLSRGDSHTSTMSSGSRFSKTDSISSGVSNLGSPINIPPTIPSSPPPEGQPTEDALSSSQSAANPCNQHHWHAGGDGPSTDASPFLPFKEESGEPLAIWVASTISQIPPGSIIINPHTREPYKNHDGSLYRWYPPGHDVPEKEKPRMSSAEVEAPALPSVPEIVPEAPHRGARVVSRHQSAGRTQESASSSHRTSLSTSFKSSSVRTKIQLTSVQSVATTLQSSSISTPSAHAMNISLPYSGVTTTSSPGTSALVPSGITTLPLPSAGATPQPMYVVMSSGRYQVAPPVPQMYVAPSLAPTAYCPISATGHVHPIRFTCPPQGLSFPSIGGPALPVPAEQPSPAAPETPHYTYVQPLGAYPAAPDTFQVMGYATQMASEATYQQPPMAFGAQQVAPQPYAMVPQYADKATWNQYAPMSLVPAGRSSSIAYYAVDSAPAGFVAPGQNSASSSGVQLVVVSSASNADLTHGNPVMYGQPPPPQMLPANDNHAFIGGAGAPQYVHYTYQTAPTSAQSGSVQMMPCYPNVLSVPGPVPTGTPMAPVRGPAPCVVPVVRPMTGLRSLPRRSPSPKSVQFPTPPAQSGGLVRMPPTPEHLGFRLPEIGSDRGRPPPTRQPRFAPIRSTQNSIAFRPPVIVNTGDSRCQQVPLQRVVQTRPLVPAFLHKPRMIGGNLIDTANVPASNESRKCLTMQPRHGVSAEVGFAVLEVCDLPPVLQRHELDSYLNDLTAFGAKQFYVHDDPEVTPSRSKDMTCVGSAAAVVAVFDSAASAQRALREQNGGKRYRLKAASRTYDLNQPQRS